MNDKNLQRLLHVSPSPEELTITEQMAKDKEEGNTLETYLRNSLFIYRPSHFRPTAGARLLRETFWV